MDVQKSMRLEDKACFLNFVNKETLLPVDLTTSPTWITELVSGRAWTSSLSSQICVLSATCDLTRAKWVVLHSPAGHTDSWPISHEPRARVSGWIGTGFPAGSVVKNAPAKAGDARDEGLIPWIRKWQPALIFLPGKFHEERSWQATVYGVMKSQTRLRDWACAHT